MNEGGQNSETMTEHPPEGVLPPGYPKLYPSKIAEEIPTLTTARLFLGSEIAEKWPPIVRTTKHMNSKFVVKPARILLRFLGLADYYSQLDLGMENLEMGRYPKTELEQMFWQQVLNAKAINKEYHQLDKEDWNNLLESDHSDVEESRWFYLIDLARDIFIHIGLAIVNPGQKKSTSTLLYTTPFQLHFRENYWRQGLVNIERKNQKLNVRDRDGSRCVLTDKPFRDEWLSLAWLPDVPADNGISPQHAHIIPRTVGYKPLTLLWISIVFGPKIAYKVLNDIETKNNLMNIEANAHWEFDCLRWGIKAVKGDIDKGYLYFYQRIPTPKDPVIPGSKLKPEPGPGFIRRAHDEAILFGKGDVENGPSPILCNLELHVARAMHFSKAGPLSPSERDALLKLETKALKSRSPETFKDIPMKKEKQDQEETSELEDDLSLEQCSIKDSALDIPAQPTQGKNGMKEQKPGGSTIQAMIGNDKVSFLANDQVGKKK
ncbi:hypothetical protein BDV93DRAFT_609576 [Ceratobasidium sp. AG-I]|nr:hypothetical protein BDV93DRAFT_609576 [Ceratobasidium sp. AG-I]